MSRIEQLKEYIKEEPERLEKLLEEAGFCSISYNTLRKEFRCAYEEGGNPTGVSVNAESLYGTIYTKNISGDIIEIIKARMDMTFIEALSFIEKTLKIGDDFYMAPTREIYGGYYKKFKKYYDEREKIKLEDSIPEIVYKKDILLQFKSCPSKMFREDGISYETQKLFDIHYDEDSERVIVPWYNGDGELIGAEGRYNKKEISESDTTPKWMPILVFPKTKYLYGLWQNREQLKTATNVYVFESSKSVMLMKQNGMGNVVATGGKNISDRQLLSLLQLTANTIILCFDKDVEEGELIKQCEKFSSFVFFKKKVYYVIDKENRLGEKDSPIDKGFGTFRDVIKEGLILYG